MTDLLQLTAVQTEHGGPITIHTDHCSTIPAAVRRFDLDSATDVGAVQEVWSDELDEGDLDVIQAARNTAFHTCTGLVPIDIGEDTLCQHERDDLSLCANEARPGSTRCSPHQDDGQADADLNQQQGCGTYGSRRFR